MKEKINIILKMAIILAVLIIAGSVFYYYIFFLPSIEKEKISIEKEKIRQKELNKNLLNECLANVEKETERLYWLNFPNCQTTECLKELGDGLERMQKEKKEECFKKYPQ